MTWLSAKPRYTKAVIDCSDDEPRTEQSHKGSVDINKIVAKTGVDRIAENMKLQALSFDTNPYNNYQEMMEHIATGKSAFESLDAETRSEFDNSPAKYMDYVLNPENSEAMIERGWLNPANPTPEPVEVVIKTTETPLVSETPPE